MMGWDLFGDPWIGVLNYVMKLYVHVKCFVVCAAAGEGSSILGKHVQFSCVLSPHIKLYGGLKIEENIDPLGDDVGPIKITWNSFSNFRLGTNLNAFNFF